MLEKWTLNEDIDIMQWYVIEKLDQKSFEFGLIILWAIWTNCNDFVMQEKRRTS